MWGRNEMRAMHCAWHSARELTPKKYFDRSCATSTIYKWCNCNTRDGTDHIPIRCYTLDLVHDIDGKFAQIRSLTGRGIWMLETRSHGHGVGSAESCLWYSQMLQCTIPCVCQSLDCEHVFAKVYSVPSCFQVSVFWLYILWALNSSHFSPAQLFASICISYLHQNQRDFLGEPDFEKLRLRLGCCALQRLKELHIDESRVCPAQFFRGTCRSGRFFCRALRRVQNFKNVWTLPPGGHLSQVSPGGQIEKDKTTRSVEVACEMRIKWPEFGIPVHRCKLILTVATLWCSMKIHCAVGQMCSLHNLQKELPVIMGTWKGLPQDLWSK